MFADNCSLSASHDIARPAILFAATTAFPVVIGLELR